MLSSQNLPALNKSTALDDFLVLPELDTIRLPLDQVLADYAKVIK